MNAKQLADELEKSPDLWFKDDIAGKWIIEKLRQQQAEIDMLKKLLDNFGISVNRKPAKYSDEWWKEVEEFNKQLRIQKND